jgi:hypothetical protein
MDTATRKPASTGDATANPGSRSPAASPSRYLRCLTPLLAADGRLFAGLSDGQIWESRDGGDSWAAPRLEGERIGSLLALVGT